MTSPAACCVADRHAGNTFGQMDGHTNKRSSKARALLHLISMPQLRQATLPSTFSSCRSISPLYSSFGGFLSLEDFSLALAARHAGDDHPSCVQPAQQPQRGAEVQIEPPVVELGRPGGINNPVGNIALRFSEACVPTPAGRPCSSPSH